MTHECVPSKASPRLKQSEAHDLTETEAIRLAQKGDAAAFEWIFRMHGRRVYTLCLRMVRNTSEAEDLTQEAFLQLFQKIQTFRGESAFSTWLHRVSVNVVLMRLRKKTVMETPLEDVNEEEDSNRSVKEIGALDPVLSGAIDRIILDRAIGKLPPGYRKAVMFHDVHGYEHCEIAEIMGCSVGNSKSQLHKARRQLRNLLCAAPNDALKAVSRYHRAARRVPEFNIS
jgi:RNA polymerase sigma-70 factor (ECF subfamily)